MFSLLLKGLTPPCYDIISSERSSFRASTGVFVFQLSLTVNREYGIFTDFNGDLDLIELGIYTLFYLYDVSLVIFLFCLVCLSVLTTYCSPMWEAGRDCKKNNSTKTIQRLREEMVFHGVQSRHERGLAILNKQTNKNGRVDAITVWYSSDWGRSQSVPQFCI